MISQPVDGPERARKFYFPDVDYHEESESRCTPSSTSSCYSSYQVSKPSTVKRLRLLRNQFMHFHVENHEYVCEPQPSPESLARTKALIELVDDAVRTCPDRIPQYLSLCSTSMHSMYQGKTTTWGVVDGLAPTAPDRVLPLAETEEEWDRWVNGTEKPPYKPKQAPSKMLDAMLGAASKPTQAVNVQACSEPSIHSPKIESEAQDTESSVSHFSPSSCRRLVPDGERASCLGNRSRSPRHRRANCKLQRTTTVGPCRVLFLGGFPGVNG